MKETLTLTVSDAKACFLSTLMLLAWPLSASAEEDSYLEYFAEVEFEARLFSSKRIESFQHGSDAAIAFRPEFILEHGEWDLNAKLLARYDSEDQARSHVDIRELLFSKNLSRDVELRFGIGQVFWGVTEARHVVNIINQDDLVEGPLREERLGQPMINMNIYTDYGRLEAYLLPFFRERTFPSAAGRLRTTPRPCGRCDALYESSRGRQRVDLALRWSKRWHGLDVAISQFQGISREPVYQLVSLPSDSFQIPFYHTVSQTGLETQYAHKNTLYKLEAFYRKGQVSPFVALDVGIERTISNIGGSGYDLGLLVEYLYESRETLVQDSFLSFNPQENDLMTGLRLGLNDINDSQLLFTLTTDLDNQSKLFTIKANTRLSDNWTLVVEGMFFADIDSHDPLYTLRKDNFLGLMLRWNF